MSCEAHRSAREHCTPGRLPQQDVSESWSSGEDARTGPDGEQGIRGRVGSEIEKCQSVVGYQRPEHGGGEG